MFQWPAKNASPSLGSPDEIQSLCLVAEDWVKRTSGQGPQGVNSPSAFRLESALLYYKTIEACLLERVFAIKVGLPVNLLVATGVHFHASVRFKANQTSPNCNDFYSRGTGL